MIYLYIPHPLASSWRPPPKAYSRRWTQPSGRATGSLRRRPACSLASTPGKRKLICANNGLDESDKHLPDKAHLGQPPSWLHGRIHCQCTEGTKKEELHLERQDQAAKVGELLRAWASAYVWASTVRNRNIFYTQASASAYEYEIVQSASAYMYIAIECKHILLRQIIQRQALDCICCIIMQTIARLWYKELY